MPRGEEDDVDDTTWEQVVTDLVAAAPNLVLSAVLVGVVAVVHRRSMRLPDRVVLPGIAASVLVLAATAAVTGSADVLVRGLVGGLVAFAAAFLVAMTRPDGLGSGVVKAAALVGVPAGVLGTQAWVTGVAAAIAVGMLWKRRAQRRYAQDGVVVRIPGSVLLLVWLVVSVLTPWMHLGLDVAGS